jgi:hypothetical protein
MEKKNSNTNRQRSLTTSSSQNKVNDCKQLLFNIGRGLLQSNNGNNPHGLQSCKTCYLINHEDPTCFGDSIVDTSKFDTYYKYYESVDSECVYACCGAFESECCIENESEPEPSPSISDPTPSYSDPTPSYLDPTPSYFDPTPSYSDPTPSLLDPTPYYSDPTPSYSDPIPSSPLYGNPAPTYTYPTPSYSTPTTTSLGSSGTITNNTLTNNNTTGSSSNNEQKPIAPGSEKSGSNTYPTSIVYVSLGMCISSIVLLFI